MDSSSVISFRLNFKNKQRLSIVALKIMKPLYFFVSCSWLNPLILSCVSVRFHPHRGGSGTVRIGQLPRMQPRSRDELIKGDQLSPRMQTVFRNADAITL